MESQEKYNCPNCGAPIDRGRHTCAYCGTQFEWGWGPIPMTQIEFVQADVVPIRARLDFDASDLEAASLSKDEVKVFIVNRLLELMTPALIANMEVTTRIDVERLKNIIVGELLIGRKRR